MGLHKIHLLLQLILISPIVISLAHSNIAASGSGEIKGSADIGQPFGILIFRLKNRKNPFRKTLRILPDNLSSSVSRGVIMDQNFIRKIRFLF